MFDRVLDNANKFVLWVGRQNREKVLWVVIAILSFLLVF